MPAVDHLREYVSEGSLLATFMVAACCASAAFFHPDSPIAARVRSPVARRVGVGVLMGLTAVALVRSPIGLLSGAHMNPSVTVAFAALGKLAPLDAVGYVVAQVIGGAIGVVAARGILGGALSHASVNHAATLPGPCGAAAAWACEFAIAFGMMGMVLVSSNTRAFAPYTAHFAGVLIALYITFEAPFSGMSMNPARTLASAMGARQYRALWVYFTAPPLGMLAAAGLYAGVWGCQCVYCGKLDHSGHDRCIFRCRIDELRGRTPSGDIP